MKKVFFGLSCIVAITLFTTACDLYPSVEYKVTGNVSAVDITIENSSGGTSQYSDQSLPWSYSFESTSGSFVYVSAQNQDSSGSIEVSIYVDDDRWKDSSSSGGYCIATCSGSLP
jgi:hypothetical protein